jgi:hypothetical protein
MMSVMKASPFIFSNRANRGLMAQTGKPAKPELKALPAMQKIGGDLWGNRFSDCGCRRGIQGANQLGRVGEGVECGSRVLPE